MPILVTAQINLGPEITVSGGSFDNLHPRIALTANNIPVVMWGSANSVYTARWNGTSFDSPLEVTSGTYDPFTSDWAGPDIAAKGDTVFVVYKAKPEETNPIIIVRSIDGGKSFGPESEVTTDTFVTRFPDIAVNEAGHPTVTAMEFVSGWMEPEYITVTSNDYGATFNQLVKAAANVPGESCDCCEAEIISGDNEVTLMFRNNDANLRENWMVHSSNGGASYQNSVEIDTTNFMVPVCLSSGPHGIFYFDSLLTVWMSAPTNRKRVFVSTLSRNDWQMGIHQMLDGSVSTTTYQDHPRVAGEDDIVAVVWESVSSGVNTIEMTYSASGAEGLPGPSFELNANTSGRKIYPDIAYGDNAFHIVWQDNATNEVKYRKASLGTLGIEENLNPLNVKISPNPAIDHLTLTSTSGIQQVDIIDLAGKVSKSKIIQREKYAQIDVSDLPAGLYLLRVSGIEGASYMQIIIQ